MKIKTYYSQNMEVIITRKSILKLLNLRMSRKLKQIQEIVHVRTSRTLRHEWERIQSELGTIAHPEIWRGEDWLELLLSWRRRHVCCTPQITREKHTSRGLYKTQVLSRYHRPTQNRKQYISNNIIKSTTILNRRQQQVQEPLATTPSTPMRTQASIPYSFGK